MSVRLRARFVTALAIAISLLVPLNSAWAAAFTVTGTITTSGTSDVEYVNGYVVQAASGQVFLFDAVTGSLAHTLTATGTTSPAGSAVRGSKVYIANSGSSNLTIVDTVTHSVTVLATPGCSGPDRILIVGSRLYMPCTGNAKVQSVNLDSETVINTLSVGNLPRELSYAAGRVFVPNENSNSVTVINDAATPTVAVASIAVGIMPVASSALDSKAYIANFNSNSVTVIDASTLQVTTTIPVGGMPQELSPCSGFMVVTNRLDGTGSFIDPVSNAVSTTTFSMGGVLHKLQANAGIAYFGDFSANTVSAVDCTTRALLGSVPVTSAWYMAFDGASVGYFPPYQGSPITVASLPTAAGPSADTDVERTPPDWLKQVERSPDGACERGWGPSWAEWPNGGLGGHVCSQMLTWSGSLRAYIIAS